MGALAVNLGPSAGLGHTKEDAGSVVLRCVGFEVDGVLFGAALDGSALSCGASLRCEAVGAFRAPVSFNKLTITVSFVC